MANILSFACSISLFVNQDIGRVLVMMKLDKEELGSHRCPNKWSTSLSPLTSLSYMKMVTEGYGHRPRRFAKRII